jgi:hypothetical protein
VILVSVICTPASDMSAVARAAGSSTANGSASAQRSPRVHYDTSASVKKLLLNIRDRTNRVWNDVKSMHDTIQSLREENKRLRQIIDAPGEDVHPDDDEDGRWQEKFLKENYTRAHSESRFFLPRRNNNETD